jgi:mannose-6-phosphate isomerase-like protein (cupin superfamily)
MRLGKRGGLQAVGVVALVAAIPGLPTGAVAQGQGVIAWAPKPVEDTPWVAPHKPHWKLSEILAAHAGQQSWTETVVDDDHLKAEYISMAPGEGTPTKFYADNRAWWVVQDGQIRFTIEGQEPFVASKGFLVQVPFRVPFSMETVGDAPSLRFEVTTAGASALYPISEAPEPVPGRDYVQVRFNGRGEYNETNRPYLDFQKDVVEAGARGGAFVRDDRGFANIIRGRAQPRAPDTDLGHFHLDYAEFWFVLEGKINYLIEGLPFFTADQGDIVYVPKGRFHRASFGGVGEEMATRLAINVYPSGLHNYEAPRTDANDD